MTGTADEREIMKLARLVDRYRHAVKESVRTNSAGAINDSRVLGEKVDEALREIFDEKQRKLF
jgi:hypothetical protein